MKVKHWLKGMILFIIFSGCMYSGGYMKETDGIILKIKKSKETDARQIKVQVCTDNIIHILASAGNSFSTRPSLIVDKTNWQPVPWTVQENGEQVEISTAKITVRVHTGKGTISFYDTKGQLLLQERADSSKIITPAVVMGEQTNHIQQIFDDSPVTEAFYGLGAHQNAVMNYKGHDVDLWQYNIVDINPFLVSNKNYGILWDNNSHTKIGDIREYQSISSLKLYSQDGTEGGLTAEYFKDRDFKSLHTSRVEQESNTSSLM